MDEESRIIRQRMSRSSINLRAAIARVRQPTAVVYIANRLEMTECLPGMLYACRVFIREQYSRRMRERLHDAPFDEPRRECVAGEMGLISRT